MFEVGFSELLLIGVVALLVLGPERLPRAARMLGLWSRRARASWFSLRAEFERELSDSELKRTLAQGAQEVRQLNEELQREAATASEALSDATAQPIVGNGIATAQAPARHD